MKSEDAYRILDESDLIVNEAEVIQAINRVAREMTDKLRNLNPVLICCMNGGLIYAGQLLTKLSFPLQIDYVHATRYGNEINGFELEWKIKPQLDLQNRTVVLVDDILDEGVTLSAVSDYCKEQGATSILMSVLVEKLHQRKRKPEMRADFVGIEVVDRFLFGYGLDFKGYWRNAPGIYALKTK
ncbi:MAG: hypoxanthine-guanine phosphoribosyltransferase [Desulfuromonadaceae bacterium]|nr:hypoxanthine-guanine phosphoribosyltransferase [Desulfuromonadaceae bacterium]MDD2854187.1 hypoxanthine-guanine phosphoribosyltransferase [Desulfuromonadaceae bacterium]